MEIPKSGLQSILDKINRRLVRLVSRSPQNFVSQILTVPCSSCRHYCGFRYGMESFNPYENYIIGLHEGRSYTFLRERFEDFLQYYRPRNFGELLGLKLSSHIPLWVYPWSNMENYHLQNGWLEDVTKVPDIITHFCDHGIQRTRIEEEYFWLERAYSTIVAQGYQPERFGYIEVIELSRQDESVYIIADGNHRLSALIALGHQDVSVKWAPNQRIVEAEYLSWPMVQRGLYSPSDALAVFNVYFDGVDSFKRATHAATIIDC